MRDSARRRETMRDRRTIMEVVMGFWLGVGLMSIINVWKITQSANPVLYSWIMFGISIFFILICLIYLIAARAAKSTHKT